jgi:5-methylcytosine-specific restriction endonuclease McrA
VEHPTKTCTKCGETRPLERYERRTDTGRLRPVCRSCITKQQTAAMMRRDPTYQKRQYWANRDARRAYNKAYRAANKAYFAERNREYRAAHLDEMKAYIRGWREANRDRIRDYSHKRNAIFASGERVSRSEVFKRRGGKCGICRKRVDPENFHVDHIVPLARGGEHSYRNVQLAHPICNSRKRDKFPWEMTA